MIDRVLARAASSLMEDWSGPHLRLCPMKSRKPWYPKLAFFEHIILWPADLLLLLDRSNGSPQEIRAEEKMAWAVFRLQSRA